MKENTLSEKLAHQASLSRLKTLLDGLEIALDPSQMEKEADQMYTEISRDRRALTMTKTIGEVWHTLLEQDVGLHLLDAIESGIINHARSEWMDPKAEVIFDRDRKSFTVNKIGLSELCEFGFVKSTRELLDGLSANLADKKGF